MKIKHKPRKIKIKDSHSKNSGRGLKVRTSVRAGRHCYYEAGCVICDDGKIYC